MDDFTEQMLQGGYAFTIRRADGTPISMKEAHIAFSTFRLSFNDYQDLSFGFAAYPECRVISEQEDPTGPLSVSARYIYPALGLSGEAGEVAEKIKKIIRDDNGIISEQKKTELKKEIGDILWYCAALSKELGFTLESVARTNLEKLTSRKQRNVLHGEGDNR